MTTTLPYAGPQPDAEAFVWQNLSGQPGITSFCYTALSLWPGWLITYSVQVDARGTTKEQARDRADQARQTMLGLPGVPWPDGVLSSVDLVEGPFWLPDPDAGPRYCARYEVRAHPS